MLFARLLVPCQLPLCITGSGQTYEVFHISQKLKYSEFSPFGGSFRGKCTNFSICKSTVSIMPFPVWYFGWSPCPWTCLFRRPGGVANLPPKSASTPLPLQKFYRKKGFCALKCFKIAKMCLNSDNIFERLAPSALAGLFKNFYPA